MEMEMEDGRRGEQEEEERERVAWMQPVTCPVTRPYIHPYIQYGLVTALSSFFLNASPK